MRLSATVLLVACCALTFVGCYGNHRRPCLFGHHRHHRNACVDQQDWDDDDDGDHHGGGGCCDGGGYMPEYGMPMQSHDSGCGCGGSMPSYGGMPTGFDSYPQQSSCGCSGGMGMPSYPTFDQPVMMGSPMSAPTPTPANQAPPPAPGAESYYSPKGLTPMPDQASTAQPAF